MAQHGNTLGRSLRRAEYRGNAVTMQIMKDNGFFHMAVIQSSRQREGDLCMYDLRWPVCVTQQENAPAGCSKRPSSKAAGESKPEACPRGYVEDFDEPRTLLADFFSILLLALEKVEMIRGSSSVTDRETMA